VAIRFDDIYTAQDCIHADYRNSGQEIQRTRYFAARYIFRYDNAFRAFLRTHVKQNIFKTSQMELKANSLSSKAQLDIELVQQAIYGDQKAYAELLDRYRDAIYYTLLKMVNNSSDAEDLTIEAFGKAFKNIRQYTPNFAFSTWLFKIASNNAIDFIRKKKLNNISIDDSVHDTDAAPISIRSEQPTPEENLIAEQKILMVRAVVAKLKPRYRKLVELRYFYEYTYEEISSEMGLPIGTVKAQLFRARELLQNVLKDNKIQP